MAKRTAAGWRIATATAGVCLAGCNAIWGLEERPLAGAMAPADDASDASAPSSDAVAEASDAGMSCTAPLPVARDAAVACPALDGGACGPQNIATTSFPWVGPTRPNNQCSPAQLTAAIAACLSSQATPATCSAWKAQNMDNQRCFSCLFSDLGAPTYGPYYVYPGDYATFNNAGCVVLLDPCWEPCAEVFESYVDCDYNACAPSCSTPEALATCGNQANGCVCVAQYQATLACQNAITASGSPAAACLTTDQNSIDQLLGLFCGAPDGG